MPIRMAKVRRSVQDGGLQETYVNPEQVQYVFPQSPGAYIAFENDQFLQPSQDATGRQELTVHPKGILSPDTVEEVVRRLNKPYRADLWFKIITLGISVAAIVVAILWG